MFKILKKNAKKDYFSEEVGQNLSALFTSLGLCRKSGILLSVAGDLYRLDFLSVISVYDEIRRGRRVKIGTFDGV